MKKLIHIFALTLVAIATMHAQTTDINYQGSLKNNGAAANGNYDFEFKLFDSLMGGTQIGPTVVRPGVPVSGGVFNVKIDFGQSALPGANRWIEIAVRQNAGENFVTLSPREQIASAPYSVRTLSAAHADSAADSDKLGGVAASEYVTNLSGGTAFIRNGTSIQTGNFAISGNGAIMGTLGIGTATPNNNRLDVVGPIRSFAAPSTQVVAETVGAGPNNWARFYMVSPSRTWFMGTSQNFNDNQFYIGDATSNQTRMVITTTGRVGIGTTAPSSIFEVAGTGSAFQQRITDTASGNSLVLQGGAGSNTKVTGYNFGSNTAVPLHLSVDGAHTIMNTGGGGVGIGTATPNAKLSVIGNVTQDSNSFGVPKAMLFVLANGTIARCFNGMTNSTSGNCGFSVSTNVPGHYDVAIGINLDVHFLSLSSCGGGGTNVAGRILGTLTDTTKVAVKFFDSSCQIGCSVPSDFMLIVY